MRPAPGLTLLALALLITACAGGTAAGPTPGPGGPTAPAPTELTVFAAASLADAFGAIGSSFEQANPGVRVVFNFAGSQQLAAQLGQGAPADVFASANAAQMDAAVAAGRVAAGSARAFLTNRLVVVATAASAAKIADLKGLATPGVKLIFAAKAVPAGQYSLAFLDAAAADPAFGPGYRDAVLKNVVSYEDSVRAVLAKVALGEGDAGIVYVSDAAGSADATLTQIAIPASLNQVASYPVAPISDAPNAARAQQFVDYLFAAEAQAILTRYGFTLP